MATIKHISIKNSNYGGAEKYLKYEHDEKTNKPIKDSKGNLVERKDYMISGVNCNPNTFGIECVQTNLKYKQNLKRGEIKAHHYIISFDPKDKAKGLTVEKAQRLGEEFCKKNFKGHQAIVATHGDGHNRSGNIHCHVIFNSVRTKEVTREKYMERPSEYKEGFKHRCSGKFLYHIRVKVMEMCKREKLNQIDLLHGKSGIKDREYHAFKRATGKQQNNKSTFETYKQELRDCINVAKIKTSNFDEFKDYLTKNYDIGIKESRGRISYIHPQRKDKRPIRDDKLGKDYRKDNIIYGNTKQNRDNALRGTEKNNPRELGDTRSQSTHASTRDSAGQVHRIDHDQNTRNDRTQSKYVESTIRDNGSIPRQQSKLSQDYQQKSGNRTH